MTPGEIFLAVGSALLAGAVTYLCLAVRDLNKHMAELLAERALVQADDERAAMKAKSAREQPPTLFEPVPAPQPDLQWPHTTGRHALTDNEVTGAMPVIER